MSGHQKREPSANSAVNDTYGALKKKFKKKPEAGKKTGTQTAL